jgi:predicted enzyme related to lactoylglutathione lyase
MLKDSRVEANIPAGDLARAREFYSEKLGLTPVDEFAGEVLMYETAAGTRFNIYRTKYAGQAGHTIAQLHVDDVEAEVRELKSKGVTFEVYEDMPVEWHDDIATAPGMGRAAWFKDSEGNILGIDDSGQTS